MHKLSRRLRRFIAAQVGIRLLRQVSDELARTTQISSGAGDSSTSQSGKQGPWASLCTGQAAKRSAYEASKKGSALLSHLPNDSCVQRHALCHLGLHRCGRLNGGENHTQRCGATQRVLTRIANRRKITIRYRLSQSLSLDVQDLRRRRADAGSPGDGCCATPSAR